MTRSRPSATGQLDPKAVEILFRRYWSPRGWTTGVITSAEFEYAKQAGVMFEPEDLTHDEVVQRAVAIRGRVSTAAVGNAFLASLSSRRMDWRSALGSLAAILHLVEHPFKPQVSPGPCAVCGGYRDIQGDINVLNFERLKWGGVRHYQPRYAALDLEWFLSRTLPQPGALDMEIFRGWLQRIEALPPTARPADIEKALRGTFPSNASERRVAIEILGLAGILIPRDRPTFWGEYPLSSERDHPGGTNDWSYPVLWWRGADGINWHAVKFWFPGLA